MNHVRIGSKVYYKDNGPEDTGTIVDIVLDEYPFVVKWDIQYPSVDEVRKFPKNITDHFGVKSFAFIANKADENIDQFKGNQLVLVEY